MLCQFSSKFTHAKEKNCTLCTMILFLKRKEKYYFFALVYIYPIILTNTGIFAVCKNCGYHAHILWKIPLKYALIEDI